MVIFAVGTVEWFGAVSHVVVGKATVWASLAVSADSFCVTNFLHFFASVIVACFSCRSGVFLYEEGL